MKQAFINILYRLGNLITIKSVVTLALTLVFCVLAIKNIVSEQVFISVYSVIIGFYFGTQKVDDTNKNKDESTE